jgi:signal transduction histidine kinase/CheY-like chemotaxis protein
MRASKVTGATRARATRLRGSHVDITERAELQAQFLQAQKMEAIGRLAGGVAHDFNNLLCVILSTSAYMLSEMAPSDEMRQDIEEIAKAGERAAALTRQLLLFSRQQVVAPRVVDLNDVLENMRAMLDRIVGEDVEIRRPTGQAKGHVRIDPGSLEQVVMNLIVNARDAMPKGGKLTLETSDVVLDEAYARENVGARPGPHVLLAVADTGVGMDRKTLARIFEPFFTTKGVGKGSGLGLSTVFGIVQQSGGSVRVYSEPGAGTTFKIYLPAVDEAATLRTHIPPASLNGTDTILLVEDEEQVRNVARSILVRHGYKVLEAKSAAEAQEVCEAHGGAIHLLLSDVVMPGMSGPELVKRFAVRWPRIRVLCMSGYTDERIVEHGAVGARFAFLQKPITPDSLARKVREVLDAPK